MKDHSIARVTGLFLLAGTILIVMISSAATLGQPSSGEDCVSDTQSQERCESGDWPCPDGKQTDAYFYCANYHEPAHCVNVTYEEYCTPNPDLTCGYQTYCGSRRTVYEPGGNEKPCLGDVDSCV